ncbi:hypothetical protein K504DRAFT_508865 [Pleomassaria siparia CBS 279.74]|uniref:Uncharacterized protein n=1 Tax=Pleomassaria siparia CBS 279.74 TaxID=1314801 RepID=A0A6G1JQU8_9PLEO|nr:hypothetical protein K504DRAFT_508865 [Pleomassaria siparia CBS 279.74]
MLKEELEAFKKQARHSLEIAYNVKAASHLRKVDEPTYNRMRQSHRDISKAVLNQPSNAEGHQA